MKQIITILLLLLPLCSFSQSKESNRLYKQGENLYQDEKYEEALPYFQKSDSLDKATLSQKSKNYYRAELKLADCWNEIAYSLNYDGKYAEALNLEKKVVDIRKKALGEEHPEYADALNNLGLYYYNNGNYTEAVKIETTVVEIYKKIYGEEHDEYATTLDNLAGCYADMGNYAEAIRLATIAMEIRKKVLGEEHTDYTYSLNNLASYYDEIGNYAEAIRLATIAMEIRKKVLGEEHPDYADELDNLAGYYDDIGNYAEAIRLATIAMEIRKKVLGEEHPDYAMSLNNLACYQNEIGNYAEAIRLATIVMEIWKKVLGEEHPDYAISLSNLAMYNSEIDNLSEAIRLENLALEIKRKTLGEDHSLFAISLENLASYNYQLDNNSEAIRLENQVKEIYQKAFGEAHPYYAEALRDLAKYNFNAGNYTDAVEYYKQGYDRTSSFVMKNFSWMTSNERMNYWKKFSDFYDTDLPYAAYKIADNADITALAYNSLVFSKGLLLNAEIEIQNLIEQSGDTTLANQFYKLKSDRSMLDNLYQLPPDERYMDADSLSKVIEKEERQLVESCKEIGDYTRNLSIDWREIQKNMNDNDLAVEFANFKDTAAKQVVYIALVLKKGMTSPKLVKLYESDNFYDIKTGEYYRTPKLYNLIWKPLAQYLDGVKNVYFSPVGRLHTVGIEYLPDENGKIFAEKFDAYRLSSTRELAMERTVNPNKKAATYGGIKYDFSEDDWQNIKEENDSIRNYRDTPKIAENLRGGMSYLAGTRLESATVAALLRTAQYDVSALSDADATEESFKKLSGTGLKILHIGTHGFYETASDMENSGLKFYTATQQNDEDRSLSCSGLLFAGANSALDPKRNKEIPEGADDGILTAKEISRLVFKGLDLVVLSACQTGLGEITGEGVFGLQRGFKKAGAQTIVMSLWKVDDESTQLLMTEFFKNLTAGQSKRAAFIAAQKTVRDKYPNPLHWAAFVMVDGI